MPRGTVGYGLHIHAPPLQEEVRGSLALERIAEEEGHNVACSSSLQLAKRRGLPTTYC